MENIVKASVEGINPKTEERQTMAFEGDAVCVVCIKDQEDGFTAEQAIVGALNADGALALIKANINVCKQLLNELPPIVSGVIMSELFSDIMRKADDDEQAALRDYDARRAADELA